MSLASEKSTMFEEGWVAVIKAGQKERQTAWEEKERMKMKNPCGKMRGKDKPYEVWQSPDGSWTWKVLKKYKTEAGEADDPYARWFCFVTSPFCEYGELGDVYVREIKATAVKVS